MRTGDREITAGGNGDGELRGGEPAAPVIGEAAPQSLLLRRFFFLEISSKHEAVLTLFFFLRKIRSAAAKGVYPQRSESPWSSSSRVFRQEAVLMVIFVPFDHSGEVPVSPWRNKRDNLECFIDDD